MHRHIQLNGPTTFRWMPHDIDHSGAYFAHRDANVPEPNVIAINPENGHAHCAVLLTTPIARHAASRVGPLRFYGAVERGIARRIGADRQYFGLICKNPVHADWRVEWRRAEPYTLSELADWLFSEDMRPDTTRRDNIRRRSQLCRVRRAPAHRLSRGARIQAEWQPTMRFGFGSSAWR